MSTNISKQHREDLLDKIRQIRTYIAAAPQDKNTGNLLQYLDELTKDVKGKKYGLVFEQHHEHIDEILETHTPVLTEQPNLFIDNGGEMNFLIEGDNLAALQLLMKTHKRGIDMIYIDPPYNTGNKDFMYDDCFVDGNDTFRHSKWLSFMEKRLRIAKDLLCRKGIILISIDDNEQAPLKLLCDEIFDEKNFVASLIWRGGKRNMAKWISTSHEYMLLYAKNLSYCSSIGVEWHEKKQGLNDIYNSAKRFVREANGNYEEASSLLKEWFKCLPDSNPSKDHKHYCWIDAKGVYFASDISRGGGGGPKWEIKNPYTGENVKIPQRGWAYSTFEELQEDIDNGLIHFNGSGVPCKKRYLKDNETQILDSVFYKDRRGSSKRLRELMGGDLFTFPKDEIILEEKFKSFSSTSSIILDFFAGSGTTGHAVMKLNAEDGGRRKFILCTNNENNICRDVTYERLHTVITGKRKDDSDYDEQYNASLKYFKIDFIPISEKLYYEYADELLLHIRELVELENGINFNGNDEIAIVLTDEEMEQFVAQAENQTKVLYRGHDVLLTSEQEEYLKTKGIQVNVIPDYYYNELNR